MSLRSQLLAVSLLLLSLPWAGCQYLREMESTLRQGQRMAADASARAIASALRERPGLLYPVAARRGQSDSREDWYVATAKRDLISDGYSDDWREQAQIQPMPDTPPGLRLYAASRRGRLFVLIEVDDASLRYRTPSQAGDRVVLHCIDALGASSHYELSAEAPGLIRPQMLAGRLDQFAQSIRAAWREQAQGYAVELQLPLDARCQRLSVLVIDVHGHREAPVENERYNSQNNFSGQSPWLVYQVAALDDWLDAFEEPGRSIEVHDALDWMVGRSEYSANTDGDTAANDDTEQQVFWLLRLIYRAVLSDNNAIDTESDADHRLRIHAVAQVEDTRGNLGSVKVSETTERYLALTDRASSRVFGISAIVLLLAFTGLLLFASLLSWRIRRLRDAALEVAAETTAPEAFPRSNAADELGQLSRSYADLLRQINEYNAYLRGLARTLSHELRTPIAVVSSSLDNLHNDKLSLDEQQDYVHRAQEGLSRLTRIVTAMSEASRIEESLEGSCSGRIDLPAMLRALTSAYRTTFADNRFALSLQDGTFTLRANGELIAQALDKLVENAVSFAHPGSVIELRLHSADKDCVIDVINRGPILPGTLRERLFEPMVSLRSGGDHRGAGKSDDTHLGLGLHIARTIALAHAGTLQAADLPTGDGVVFSLRLPAE